MSILADLQMYARFAWGLRGFLREHMTVAEATTIVQRRMAERDSAFLRLVERGIFGYPRSPYLPLLKLAQCELGDLQTMVRTTGLEGTLGALRAAGVYFTFEEFKGREPVVRQGQTWQVRPSDFDNPYLSHFYHAETGGSTGAGTRVSVDLDHIRTRSPHAILAYAAHDVLDAPSAMWRGILPDNTGISHLLRGALSGHVPERWFTPLSTRAVRPSMAHRLATWYIVGMGRLWGAPFPWPEPVGLDEAHLIAQWAAEQLKTHRTCLIRTGVSMAVRVAVAAQAAGLDLTGVIFMGGTEPPTVAKVQAIRTSGARQVPFYSSSDIGQIGVGCANPVDTNDLHLMHDYLAVIQAPRLVPGTSLTVDAFLYTTLAASAPKLMLNVESDDYGIIETRHCGCMLEQIGYTQHLREIFSFRKLTGEGVTLIGSEMLHILETVLPSRFGGSPLDYQLEEEEDAAGMTRLNLRVDPRLDIPDEMAVVETVLNALAESSRSANLAQALWRQAGTLRVRREVPITSMRGKVNPLHLKRRSKGIHHA